MTSERAALLRRARMSAQPNVQIPEDTGTMYMRRLISELADDIERLQRNLRGRDDFIVGKDLWGEFTDSLRPADA